MRTLQTLGVWMAPLLAAQACAAEDGLPAPTIAILALSIVVVLLLLIIWCMYRAYCNPPSHTAVAGDGDSVAEDENREDVESGTDAPEPAPEKIETPVHKTPSRHKTDTPASASVSISKTASRFAMPWQSGPSRDRRHSIYPQPRYQPTFYDGFVGYDS